MKPKILNDITNIFAKLSGSKDYDPRVKYDTALEYYANQVPVVPKPGSGDSGKAIVAGTDNAYKLENVELEKLVVNITVDDHQHYSADKTLAELNAAYSAGKKIEFHYYTYVLPVVYYQNNNYQATIASISDTGAPAGVISIFYNAFGVYLVVDGPFERAIHVTLHPDTMQFSFMSIEALNAVQSGTPFKLSVTINGDTRYLLCQLNTLITTNTYKATLIDGFVIYTAQVVFNGATATIYNDIDFPVLSVEELRQISTNPCATGDGHDNAYWGFDDGGALGYHPLKSYILYNVSDAAAITQFSTILGVLRTSAKAAQDKQASAYIQSQGISNILTAVSVAFGMNKTVLFVIGDYVLNFDSAVFNDDPNIEALESATFSLTQIDKPATIGTDPAGECTIKYSVTDNDIAILSVSYRSVPALTI